MLVIDVGHRCHCWLGLLLASFGSLHAPSDTMKASLKGGSVQVSFSLGASGPSVTSRSVFNNRVTYTILVFGENVR